MLKVVVFDSGWGGELLADFLSTELPILDIIRVIDWRHAPYSMKTKAQLLPLAQQALEPYLGKVDLIIFANQLVSLSLLDYFAKAYPKQAFLGFPLLFNRISLSRFHQVLILSTSSLFNHPSYQALKHKLHQAHRDLQIIETSCDRWEQLIDDGELKRSHLNHILPATLTTDAIFLEHAHFLDFKPQLEQICGWRTQVYDAYRYILQDVCDVLHLRGSTGKRRR